MRFRRTGKPVILLASLLAFSDLLFAGQLLNEVDRTLPEFELAAMDGEQWRTETLAGKTWVINFWATWCPPCVEEMPSMNEAWQALESQGVGMLAINAGEGQGAVAAFLEKIPIDFPVLLGDGDSLATWSIRALPTTIVVNANGDVVFEALGPREWNDEALLASVLKLQTSLPGKPDADK